MSGESTSNTITTTYTTTTTTTATTTMTGDAHLLTRDPHVRSVCISGNIYLYHSGDLCCAYECHDVDGVLSYIAVLVAVYLSLYHQ
jgi:carbohydrate-binding DOMON domain-containing protein